MIKDCCFQSFMLPIIDLQESNEICAQKLHDAAIQHGFFYLSGHGISSEMFDKVFEQIHNMFDLNMNDKLSMQMDINKNLNGYIPYKGSDINYNTKNKVQQQFDTKEFYRIDNDNSKFVNQWPSDKILPKTFKTTLNEYRNTLLQIAFRLNKIIALSLGLNENYFDKYFKKNIDTINLLHYFPILSDANNNRFGVGPHCDFGMFTLLMIENKDKENGDGNGLQILINRNGSLEYDYDENDNLWVDIEPKDYTFIVNIADVLAVFSNDYYKSTYHRVLTTKEIDRYSITFFFDPSYDSTIECIPEHIINTRTECKHLSVLFSEHLDNKLKNFIKSKDVKYEL